MFKTILFASLVCMLSAIGCGGSGSNSNVVEDADAAALAEYERLNAEGDDIYGDDYEKEMAAEE